MKKVIRLQQFILFYKQENKLNILLILRKFDLREKITIEPGRYDIKPSI